jgi:hypothetical protein
MATGNGVFDVGKSTAGFYGAKTLGSTDSLSIMLLKFNASFPADGTLGAATTFAAILALSNVVEASFTNYARIQVTTGNSIVIASHVVTFDIPDQTWTTAGGASNDTLQALIIGYKPTSGSADSAIIPLGYYGFAGTTDSSNLTAQINASGLMSWN